MKQLILWAGLALSLTGCSAIGDGLLILAGNYDYQRGDYQQAALRYLEVPTKSRAEPWVDYNLGNVYNALGEDNSALAVWNKVVRHGPEELVFRLWFNKGDLLYQKGLYQEAYHDFQQALLLKPTDLDAKRNLELCLLKIQSFSSNPLVPAGSGETPPVTPGADSRALLDYIQRLEGNRWKSNNKPEPPASSSDW